MTDVLRAGTNDALDVVTRLEDHRVELTGYCYRMLGSPFDAEDAVQETMTRAWRALDRFEGRSSLRSWLYRIATNVCLDMSGSMRRRARPVDLGPSSNADAALGAPLAETNWILPMPDSQVVAAGDPAEQAVARESIRLAFVAALQHLAPRQRAVLILREVLSWSALEVAELLDSTVASVNSALQRARATMAAQPAGSADRSGPMEPEQRALLARYVDAFERYDLDALTSLLHADATMSMPPYALWFRGSDQVRAFMLGTGAQCRGSRVVPTVANGTSAYGQYKPSGPGGRHEPWALVVLEVSAGRVAAINAFLDTARLFPLFGLPAAPGPESTRDLLVSETSTR